MAAAKSSMFDDVVVSNNPDLTSQIYLWSRELRKSAARKKTSRFDLKTTRDVFNRYLRK